jgi:hypothetical protein
MGWRHWYELVLPWETLYRECRDRRLSSARAVDVGCVWVSAALARPVGGVGTVRRQPALIMSSVRGKVQRVATNIRVTEAVNVW